MDTSKATARPWIKSRRVAGMHGRPTISWTNEKGEDCGTIAVIYSPNPDDDAALIVRAVNSHEALVAALRDLLDGTEPWDVRATQARAALALAEQGG